LNAGFEHLYSGDPRAVMMTINEMEDLLKDAIDHGPILGPDTKLYEKQGKFYRVTMPCLACLGLKEYDKTIPFVEVLIVDAYDL
jgi:hypothetical protein